MRVWWKHISDPFLWPNERLFFERYGQAPAGREHTAELLDGIVDSWLDPITALTIARRVPEKVARAHARLGVAVTRGLLIDLPATRDTSEVDRAMEAFIELYGTWLEHATHRASVPRPSGAAAPAREPIEHHRLSHDHRRTTTEHHRATSQAKPEAF